METRILLDKYIRKYYTDWLRCSRRWCSQLGIDSEAYDLLADVLVRLCSESPDRLHAMVACEESGNRWLFFYVRKALRLDILKFRTRRYKACCSIDMWSDVQQEADDADIPMELFNEFREVEANFRGDDFIDIGAQYDGIGHLRRFVTRYKKGARITYSVRYQVATWNGCQRQFGRRTSAIAFLAQNPPPE